MRAAAPSIEDLAIRSGISAEHVFLEGDQMPEAPDDRTRKIRKRVNLRNRLRGAETELVLFDDGYLSVREKRAGRALPERSIDLRYLDPRPLRSRRVAKAALAIALSSIGFSALLGLLAYLSFMPVVTLPLAFGSLVPCSAALWFFARRTEEQATFRTRHGRASVLAVVGSFGCFRAARAVSRALSATIKQIRGRSEQDKQQLLRGEMREHYRLAETGVLSAEACTAAVRRTLAHFD